MERALVVDDDPRLAARFQDAQDLPERSGHVGRVVEHPVARDAVERRVVEGQILRVAFQDLGLQTHGREMRPRQLHVARRQIDPRRVGACERVPVDVDTLAAADVEHAEPASLVVAELVRHPRPVLESPL